MLFVQSFLHVIRIPKHSGELYFGLIFIRESRVFPLAANTVWDFPFAYRNNNRLIYTRHCSLLNSLAAADVRARSLSISFSLALLTYRLCTCGASETLNYETRGALHAADTLEWIIFHTDASAWSLGNSDMQLLHCNVMQYMELLVCGQDYYDNVYTHCTTSASRYLKLRRNRLVEC